MSVSVSRGLERTVIDVPPWVGIVAVPVAALTPLAIFIYAYSVYHRARQRASQSGGRITHPRTRAYMMIAAMAYVVSFVVLLVAFTLDLISFPFLACHVLSAMAVRHLDVQARSFHWRIRSAGLIPNGPTTETPIQRIRPKRRRRRRHGRQRRIARVGGRVGCYTPRTMGRKLQILTTAWCVVG